MFQNTSRNTLKFVNDYKINLIAPRNIEDFSVFQSELGRGLEFMNASEDLEKMKTLLVENHDYYLHIDIDSARMIETFGNTKLDIEKYYL